MARSVQVNLSSNPLLVKHFGEKRLIGDITAGEKRMVVFKAVMPACISTGMASLRILVD